jgi:hypothetical protein
VLICSVIDPKAQHATALGGDLEDPDKATTDRRRCSLTNVDWNSQRRSANAESGYGSAGVYHIEIAVSGSHQGSAQQEDDRRQNDGPFSTVLFRDWESAKSAKEASRL